MACQNTENDYVKKKFGESTEIPFQQQLQKADSKLRGHSQELLSFKSAPL